MNNCFINSVLTALNTLETFKNILKSNNNELFQNILNKNSININNLVFKSRINSTQEDSEEFLTNNGFISVSLGKNVLRAETAPVCAISMINYEFMR